MSLKTKQKIEASANVLMNGLANRRLSDQSAKELRTEKLIEDILRFFRGSNLPRDFF